MPDFDRLFEQFDELRGKSDGYTSGLTGWTLILGLAISATGTILAFSTCASAILYTETNCDFLTVAMDETFIAPPRKVLFLEGPAHFIAVVPIEDI